jgi:preprotein translocase subunit SecB
MLEVVATHDREVRTAWRTARKHRVDRGEPRILAEKQGCAQSVPPQRMPPGVRAEGMYGTIVLFFDKSRPEELPMAQEITNDQASGQASQPQLVMQKIYVKDVSFEAPNAPQIFQEIDGQDQPQVQLNLGQKATDLGNNLYEVVLSLTLTCTVGQRTAYLAEVEQAGLFGIAGFNEMDHAGIIGSYCPNLLFPYARQVISSLVLEGGFPPFLLQPINFDALFAEQQRRAMGGDEVPATLNS